MARFGKPLLWLLLGLPGALMIASAANGSALLMDLLHPSGEMAVRLMVLALLPGPLIDAFGPNRFLRTWLSVRRNLGVAAFLYAVLHLIFYSLDMASLSAIVDELPLPAIWTGWLSLFALLSPALTSFDRAMRRMGRWWKKVQRLVYAAFLLSLLHWLLLDWHWQPAIIHLSPLVAAWGARERKHHRKANI
jgi:sulfoxide reductase heme-binding subunit YedZ